jgi:protein-tyrosine phosphatase
VTDPTPPVPHVRVCFVCLGNICRSPTAEGVFRRLVEDAGLSAVITIDSAGTAAYHVGESPDRRSAAAAQRRGYPLGGRSRKFERDDFDRFDYVLAMDRENERELLRLAGRDEVGAKVRLLRSFDPDSEPDDEVPDPYYGGADGFERVVDICVAGCRGLLAHLRAHDGIG